jgi:preprotein translocase subunit SecD
MQTTANLIGLLIVGLIILGLAKRPGIVTSFFTGLKGTLGLLVQ